MSELIDKISIDNSSVYKTFSFETFEVTPSPIIVDVFKNVQ